MEGVGTHLMVVTGMMITGKREVPWKHLTPPVPRWRQGHPPKAEARDPVARVLRVLLSRSSVHRDAPVCFPSNFGAAV